MNVDIIKTEMKYLQSRLTYLEEQLKEIQDNCEHRFEEAQYVETCLKCYKVNPLYY